MPKVDEVDATSPIGVKTEGAMPLWKCVLYPTLLSLSILATELASYIAILATSYNC